MTKPWDDTPNYLQPTKHRHFFVFFEGAMSDHVFIHINLKSGPYCQIYVTCSQMSKTTADLHGDYYSPLHFQVQRSS